MSQNHPRLKAFSLDHCPNPHTGDEGLKIILFKKEAKLRSHAVKHVTNTLQNFGNSREMQKAVRDLENLGCPFFSTSDYESPPCGPCNLFAPCGDHVSPLVDIYLNKIEAVIQEAANKPRYALFNGNDSSPNRHVRFLTDQRFIAMAQKMDSTPIFNLFTCFQKLNFQLLELIAHQRRKIEAESNRQSDIFWCDHSNWHPTPPAKPEKPAKKKKKPKKPYQKKGGGKNFRKYLNDYD